MASLARIFSRPAAPAKRAAHNGPVPAADLFRLRALPNEDVFLWAKRIDNSRVVREPNPKERGACWSAIGIACVVAGLLMTALAPGLANILMGYQVQTLKGEESRLLNEMRVLNVEEAGLVSRDHLEEVARTRQFAVPAPGQVVHLDPRGDGKLALNRH
jgi:hypothetical protein